jgi:hypothetical protein
MQIQKPGRLITNMLAELTVYCKNEGCTWTGDCSSAEAHTKECTFVSREVLRGQLQERDARIVGLEETLLTTREALSDCEADVERLEDQLHYANEKLQVYERFFTSSSSTTAAPNGIAAQMARLRQFAHSVRDESSSRAALALLDDMFNLDVDYWLIPPPD